jgi:hypothetical protein
MPIDLKKKRAILDTLEAEGDVIPMAAFFDGNDDEGSFAVNAAEGDWLGTAKRVFGEVAARPEVTGVWFAVVDSMDTEDDAWVYSDTAYVRSSADPETVESWVLDIAPDEIWPVEEEELPPGIEPPGPEETVYCLWWD